MGTNYYAVKNRPTTCEPIHIGKSSMGWKFLFQSHNETYWDDPIEWNTYEQVYSWLKEHVVEKKDYVIMNEYDEVVQFEEFFDLVNSKQNVENRDEFKYSRNVNGYRFMDGDFS